jgi:hypothetical protein
MRRGSAGVLARLAHGEDVDGNEYTFSTSTQIETTAPGLERLTKTIREPARDQAGQPATPFLRARSLLPAALS